MKRISRNLLAVTATASLVTLTGCAGGSSIEEPPLLSEIDELMWDTMLAEESVTINADIEMLNEGQSDEMFSEVFGGESMGATIYGPLDGSATAVGFGDTDLLRAFGNEEAYMSGDGLLALFGSQGLGEEEQEQLDAVAEEFADTWIDMSEDFADEGEEFKISEIFETIQDGWNGEDDDTPIDRAEISDEGTHEVRDDIDVWVYAGESEGQELVLVADHDAPKFYEISDGDNSMKFSDWSETASPERPEEANIITQDEAQQLIMEAIMSSAFSQ